MISALPRSVLAVSGEDRVPFLQGLVSNDVAAATEAGSGAGSGRAVWAALLTPQGKWLADFFIHAERERLLLDVEAEQAAMVAQRLGRYRLRARVAIEPVPSRVFAGWGDAAWPERAVADPRLPEAGWRLISEVAPAGAAADGAEWDAMRLRLGLPDGSRDMEAEKTTLLEAGFDELNGVSWSKGCYMGQELTARTKYRGLLKRRLVPVRVEGALPAPGTVVGADGVMRSGRDGRGLALLRVEAIRAGERLATAAGAWVSPEVPAWMQLEPMRLAGA